MKKVKYLIIGAGISGLLFAYQKADRDFLVIECDNICGGLCQSFYDHGFVWDVAGHFFHFHSEKTRRYFEELMQGKKVCIVEKCAKIFYANKYMDAPFQYNIHQLPMEEFLECLTDLYYADCPKDNLFFDEFVRKKYGKGIADKFLIPYNEKLYACNMNELERDSMGNFLPELNFDMLMKLYRGLKGETYNDTFLYPINGCMEIINTLLKQIDLNKIHLNEAVLHIDVDKKIVYTRNEWYQYEYLVNTAPLLSFAKMIGDSKAEILRYNQVLILNLGFDKPSIDKKVSWIYFPGEELFYRVGFYNNITGTEKLSIYVEIGYKADAIINVDIALRETLEELKRVGVIDKHKLIAYKPIVINPGYVHITEKGKRYTEHLIHEMENHQIYMIGRYARWQYSAMDDSIEQTFEIAERI